MAQDRSGVETDIDHGVVSAAYDWWLSKRPRPWNEKDHLAHPVVNCTTAPEMELALRVAELTRDQVNR